jgi:hypothetical protein
MQEYKINFPENKTKLEIWRNLTWICIKVNTEVMDLEILIFFAQELSKENYLRWTKREPPIYRGNDGKFEILWSFFNYWTCERLSDVVVCLISHRWKFFIVFVSGGELVFYADKNLWTDSMNG